MTTMTSVEAQNSFGRLLDTVQRGPVAITRHGRPAAFVVSPQDMEELLDSRHRRGTALEEFESWKASAKPSQAATVLTAEDVRRLVHEAR